MIFLTSSRHPSSPFLAPTKQPPSPPTPQKYSRRSTTSLPCSSPTRCNTSPGVPTTRCLITSLISSSPTKHSPPARCSTPKSATAAVLSTTQTKPPHKFIKKLMTSSPTTTSPPISAHPTKSVAWLTKNTNDI